MLERQPMREIDLRVAFFTRDFGKLTAKVRSGRSITSKLAPHLELLNFVRLRLVEKNGFIVADALRHGQFSRGRVSVLAAVAALAPDGDPDPGLWSLLEKGEATVPSVLAALGFDPAFASCASCGVLRPAKFSVVDLEYRCTACAARYPDDSDHLDVRLPVS